MAQWKRCSTAMQKVLVLILYEGGPFCNFFDQFGAAHEGPRLNLFNYKLELILVGAIFLQSCGFEGYQSL